MAITRRPTETSARWRTARTPTGRPCHRRRDGAIPERKRARSRGHGGLNRSAPLPKWSFTSDTMGTGLNCSIPINIFPSSYLPIVNHGRDCCYGVQGQDRDNDKITSLHYLSHLEPNCYSDAVYYRQHLDQTESLQNLQPSLRQKLLTCGFV